MTSAPCPTASALASSTRPWPISARAVEHRAWWALSTAALAGLATTAGATPDAGRFEATLCVQVAEQPRHCGPALLERRADGELRLQVTDFVYRLVDADTRPAVFLNHGGMQVDAFLVQPRWSGNTLRFDDHDKRVQYEVQVGQRLPR